MPRTYPVILDDAANASSGLRRLDEGREDRARFLTASVLCRHWSLASLSIASHTFGQLRVACVVDIIFANEHAGPECRRICMARSVLALRTSVTANEA